MTDFVGPASALNAVTSRPSDGRQWGALLSWFKNCTSSSAQDGTEVDADWLNQVTGFFRNLIGANGTKADGVTPVVPIDQSDNMALNAVLQLIQRGQANYAVDTGTADALLATPSVAFAEYKAGMRLLVQKNLSVAANQTTTPTINVSGLGNVTIVKNDGSALVAGDLKKGVIFEVEFDGAGNARRTGLLLSDTVQAVLNVQRTQIVADRGTQSQNVPTGVNTLITSYGNVTIESQGGTTFTNGLLTVGPGDAGLWLISFHARQSITGASGFTNGLFINGSATPIITGGANGNSSGPATIHGTGCRLLNLNAGDQVAVGLIQTTGSTVTFNDLFDMTAVRLGSS